MTYKMIVLDIDGTLLCPEGTISPRTKEALLTAQQQGVKLVLASGRPTFAMWHLAEELELHKYGSYILSFNGAKITDCQTKKDVFHCAVKPEMVHNLFDVSKREGVHIITYVADTLVTDKVNKYIEIEKETTKMELAVVDHFKEAVTEPVSKVMMLDDPEKLTIIEKKLQEEFAGVLTVACSAPFFLEFTEKDIDKGNTISRLIQQLGIMQEEVIAVGDGNNDLSMIEFAGLGVAMGNATERVKEIATYITDTNENDGVAQVVEKFILSQLVKN